MDFLSAIKSYAAKPSSAGTPLSINIITNFTDEVLEKVLGGLCTHAGIAPHILRAPYKQYSMLLKDPENALVEAKPAFSFIFFDINPYQHGEFSDAQSHVSDTLADVREYCASVGTQVVASLSPLPYKSPYGHFYADDPLFRQAQAWNEGLVALSKEIPNLYIFDTNKLVFELGEGRVRDMRGSYAFDIPFTNDFFLALSREWLACVQAVRGRSRKCIVLDLDNTLWGGVVGEAGPLGIALGPGYPGIAFQNFQRALLKLWERGIILAIASKNNLADVQEVFLKNPHVILKEEHFAAIYANWKEKNENIDAIGKELNIGTDSMVFIDDSPIERDRMREMHPEVLVPEFSLAPEAYVEALLSLTVFHQMSLTEEDKKKGQMYAEERKRSALLTKTKSKAEYIAELGITITIHEGETAGLARVAQLTQKTNQFNLTTKRYSEADIRKFLSEGWQVYAAEVTDKFGEYGTVISALLKPISDTELSLDTLLMSCRVMGRDMEFAFLDYLLKKNFDAGYRKVLAAFIPTAKNVPAKDFLREAGFIKSATEHEYECQLEEYVKEKRAKGAAHTILT